MSGIAFQSFPNRPALDHAATEMVLGMLRAKPGLVMCVATGASPTGLYKGLAAHAYEQPELFQQLRVCKLDEWLGLTEDDPGTCEGYIRRNILHPLNVAPERYIAFNAGVPNPAAECERVSRQVLEYGIDLAVLGIGANGHIGLNEPADSLTPFAHVSDLVPSTQQHAMLTGGRPTDGMTLGMAEIMSARHVLLLAPGSAKQSIVQRLMKRQITTQFPATLFWLHPNATCLTCSG